MLFFFFPSFSFLCHQLKTLTSKISSAQIWTWKTSNWRPDFFLHDVAAKMNNLIWSAIASFILKQELYCLQTPTSVTLTYGGLLIARNGHQMLISALEKGHSTYAQSKGAKRKLLCIRKRLYRSCKKTLKILHSAEQNQILKVEQK